MYRLLRQKGYRFPRARDEDLALLVQRAELMSANEIEEVDRAAQQAVSEEW